MSHTPSHPGTDPHAAGNALTSARLAASPVLDRVLRRLRLDESLRGHLPHEGRRARVPTATALLILLKNLLVSRAPLYGVGEWAARHHPTPLGLATGELPALNDGRVGRALDRLFDADVPSPTLAVVAHAVRESAVGLGELHNDSATITFHGDYEGADRQRTLRGRLRLAVTHGHDEGHRPDLKQRLYILTAPRDGAVPVQSRVGSGNATDDRSHRGTWELLCKWTGRRDSLYVADCELATAESMAHLHQHGGRFLTVLPRTRAEDAAFRAAVREGRARWQAIHERRDDDGQVVDRFAAHEPEAATAEGYRLVWYHGAREAELDALARHKRLERVSTALAELRAKPTSPRTRYRDRAKVAQAVDAILREGEAGGLVAVTVGERATETYRQGKRGRPGPETKYVRRRATRSDLPWHPDHGRLAQEARCDGASPLVTNVTALSAPELSLAYEQPPPIETRFGQLKTDCVVAPVLLEEASRVQALSCVYSVAVLVEALLGRELRRATEGAGVESLPLYPEGRACRRPTSRRVIDLSEDVRRPERKAKGRPVVVFTTELARPQRPVLRLLGMPGVYSG